MANKSYTYDVHWCWTDEGNRKVEGVVTVKSTTVQRACNKAIKELNWAEDGSGYLDKDHEEFVRSTDVMIVACQNVTKGFGNSQ